MRFFLRMSEKSSTFAPAFVIHMKPFCHIAGVVAASVGAVMIIMLSLLVLDRVETRIVQLAAGRLSRKTGTEISVGSVSCRFPARLTIRDIYVEDQQQDTLVYVREAYVHFSPLALIRNQIRFSHIRLTGGVAGIYRTDTSGQWNCQFLLDAFRNEDEEDDAGGIQKAFVVRDVQLENIRVRYDDLYAHLHSAQMDLNELSDDALDAQIGTFRAECRRTVFFHYP